MDLTKILFVKFCKNLHLQAQAKVMMTSPGGHFLRLDKVPPEPQRTTVLEEISTRNDEKMDPCVKLRVVLYFTGPLVLK